MAASIQMVYVFVNLYETDLHTVLYGGVISHTNVSTVWSQSCECNYYLTFLKVVVFADQLFKLVL